MDELLEIRQIRQYFPTSKFCAIQYIVIDALLANCCTDNVGTYMAMFILPDLEKTRYIHKDKDL